jgi:hypothetical protein
MTKNTASGLFIEKPNCTKHIIFLRVQSSMKCFCNLLFNNLNVREKRFITLSPECQNAEIAGVICSKPESFASALH